MKICNCAIGFTEEGYYHGHDTLYINSFNDDDREYIKRIDVTTYEYDYCPYCGKKIEVWNNEKH